MRGCASKTGTGRIVMIITIRQLNPLLGASLPTFWAVRSRTLDGSFKIFYMVLQKRNALLLRSLNLLQNDLFLPLVIAQAANRPCAVPAHRKRNLYYASLMKRFRTESMQRYVRGKGFPHEIPLLGRDRF